MADNEGGSPVDPEATRRRSDLFKELQQSEEASDAEPRVDSGSGDDEPPPVEEPAPDPAPMTAEEPTPAEESPFAATPTLVAPAVAVAAPLQQSGPPSHSTPCPSCSAPMDTRYDHCPRCGQAWTPTRSASASMRSATVTALIVGLVIAGAAFGIGAATNKDSSVATGSFDFDAPVATEYEPVTTEPYTPSTTSIINTPVASFAVGQAGSWVMTARDDRGYSSKVTLSVDVPVKVGDAATTSLARKVQACTVDPVTDAVVPIRVQIANTTGSFPSELGFSLNANPSSNGLAVSSDVRYSTGPSCNTPDSSNRVFGVDYPPIAAGSAAITEFFLVLHNYFSPNLPAGDTAKYASLVLAPTLTFGDTNGSDARRITAVAVERLGATTQPIFQMSGQSATPASGSGRLGTRSYGIVSELQLRTGAGTAFPSLGVIPNGTSVVVQCTTEGELVNGPYGPDSWWNKVTFQGSTGYIADEYVDTEADINDRTKIPLC